MCDFKRREFIKLSALGFASIALQLNSISSYAQSANAHFGKWNKDTNLNWDAFLEQLTKLAKNQHQIQWNQNLYTKKVKELLLQCNFPEFKNVKKEIEYFEKNKPNWIESAHLHKEVDFQVSLFQFDKGEFVSHHDHPNMTGVINVVSGNLLTKNYTIEEQLSTTREIVKNGRREIMQKCLIKEVENQIIKAGDVSVLTAHEGNIHSIMPNELTQLIDVFTPAYKPNTSTNYYKVNEDGFYLGRENIFEAEYLTQGLSQVQTIELSKEKLNLYVGSYKIDDQYFLKISRVDNQIILESTRSLNAPGRKMNLLPYEQNKFWIEDRNIRCVFNTDSKKKPKSLTILNNNGTSMIAKKIK